ncbi:MAG: glycosyltransferase family 10 [Candidatus Falkowbacteria bacterium]
MLRIKITTNFPHWPLIRQTPESKGVWGNCRFFINDDAIGQCDYWVIIDGLRKIETADCPPKNTILITSEPPGKKKYKRTFVNQFNTIITSHYLNRSNTINSQQALPWMVGWKYEPGDKNQNYTQKSYDDLKAADNIEKTKLISAISSDKAYTRGLKQRIKFIKILKKHFVGKIDIYGRNLNTFADKWDVIAPYKYHIVLENSAQNDYWTEKLSDCFLAGAYPIYYGCPNIFHYFSKGSLAPINISKPAEAIKIIDRTIEGGLYERSVAEIKKAKNLILDKYNLFPMLCDLIEKMPLFTENSKRAVTLFPESMLSGTFVEKISNRLKRWV